jgi:hypothetical protein
MQTLKGYTVKQYFDSTHNGMSLLHHACFDQDVVLVKLMSQHLEWFPNVVNDDTHGGEDGWTPLIWAA